MTWASERWLELETLIQSEKVELSVYSCSALGRLLNIAKFQALNEKAYS